MRVEAAPYVFRNGDRRQRPCERRTPNRERRTETTQASSRARHAAHVWFAPAFGAHILGQVSPEDVMPERVERAYAQPEARTPLRPNFVERA
ncbi:MAG: hypothetical protein QM773_09700 [Hyphomonadaceae bacterium]